MESVDRAACEDAIKDVEEKIKGEDKEAIDKAVERLMDAAQKIGEKLNKAAQAAQAQQQQDQGAQKADGKDDDVIDAEFTEKK